MTQSALGNTLEQLYIQRSARHLANDPLSFCHRYTKQEDRETAAIISAAFAYGSVAVIKGSLERIFAKLGSSPADYLEKMDTKKALADFAGFRHRFNNGADLVALLLAIKTMRQLAGSVEQFFTRFHDQQATTVEAGLCGYTNAVLAFDYSEIFGVKTLPKKSSFRFLFPSPVAGSACKRLCMLLRWLVRPDDGIDLGIWKNVNKAQLIIPVDLHIRRISKLLGLTNRNNADWRTACQITDNLRYFDPADPVKYDFSLCHLGISEGCTGSYGKACITCAVNKLCTSAAAN